MKAKNNKEHVKIKPEACLKAQPQLKQFDFPTVSVHTNIKLWSIDYNNFNNSNDLSNVFDILFCFFLDFFFLSML